MPIPTYTPGYPPDGSSLGQTKKVIRDNLDGTFQTLNVDHVNNNGQPGSNPAGYHMIIHEVTQTAVNTVSGVNQLFSGIPGTLVVDSNPTPAFPLAETCLYSLSGSGKLSQLTGGVRSSSSGYVWSAGLLSQWGFVNTGGTWPPSSTPTTQTFNQSFPNSCFFVLITLASSTNGVSSSSDVYIDRTALSLAPNPVTGFIWRNNITDSKVNGFYWFAMGY